MANGHGLRLRLRLRPAVPLRRGELPALDAVAAGAVPGAGAVHPRAAGGRRGQLPRRRAGGRAARVPAAQPLRRRRGDVRQGRRGRRRAAPRREEGVVLRQGGRRLGHPRRRRRVLGQHAPLRVVPRRHAPQPRLHIWTLRGVLPHRRREPGVVPQRLQRRRYPGVVQHSPGRVGESVREAEQGRDHDGVRGADPGAEQVVLTRRRPQQPRGGWRHGFSFFFQVGDQAVQPHGQEADPLQQPRQALRDHRRRVPAPPCARHESWPGKHLPWLYDGAELQHPCPQDSHRRGRRRRLLRDGVPARLRRPVVVAAPGAGARQEGVGRQRGRGGGRWPRAQVKKLQAGEVPRQRGLRHRDPGGAPDRAGRRREQQPRRPLLRSERQLRREGVPGWQEQRAEADGWAGEAAGVRGGRGGGGGPCHRSAEGCRLPARAPEPQGLVGVTVCTRCS